jgi:hypothetical protein
MATAATAGGIVKALVPHDQGQESKVIEGDPLSGATAESMPGDHPAMVTRPLRI